MTTVARLIELLRGTQAPVQREGYDFIIPGKTVVMASPARHEACLRRLELRLPDILIARDVTLLMTEHL